MRDWRRSPTIAVCAILAFAAVQLAIPIGRLGPPHVPERFGWQMFSNVPTPVAFAVETQSGIENVDLSAYLIQERADLDLTEHFPPHVCMVRADAIRVSWDSGVYEC